MSTYAQWRAGMDKADVRRVTWVCGDQLVLVEEVVDATRAALALGPLDYLSFTAGADTEGDIWAAAHQYPLNPGGGQRLVLVRAADLLTRWSALHAWLGNLRALPGAHLLFVSAEPDFPYEYVQGKRAGLKDHVEAIKARGRIVRCAQPNDIDALTWTLRRGPTLDEEMARYLLYRAGANLATVATVCGKLAALPGTPGRTSIDALCDAEPADSFVDSLLALNKPHALLAAANLPEREYGRVFALLDNRLDLLAALWRATRAGLTQREIAGLPTFLVRRYTPMAKHYEPGRCAYARRVLAVCDAAVRNGARTAVIEALVALW